MDFGKHMKNNYKRMIENWVILFEKKKASALKAWMVMHVMTNIQLVVVNKWKVVPQFAHAFSLNISFLEACVGWISLSF